MQELDDARARFAEGDDTAALNALVAAYDAAERTSDSEAAGEATVLADEMAANFSGSDAARAQEYGERFRKLAAAAPTEAIAATGETGEATDVIAAGETGDATEVIPIGEMGEADAVTGPSSESTAVIPPGETGDATRAPSESTAVIPTAETAKMGTVAEMGADAGAMDGAAGASHATAGASGAPGGEGVAQAPSAAVSGTAVRGGQPYEWVQIIVVTCFLVAGASVIGGLVEASRHTHTTFTHDVLTGRQKDISWDYNYLWAGIGSGFLWLLLGTVVLLLRSLAMDLRRLADRDSASS